MDANDPSTTTVKEVDSEPSIPGVGEELVKESAPIVSEESRLSKRIRSRYQPFQSPEALSLLAKSYYRTPNPVNKQNNDEKIVVFSRGDFLAVRNEAGGFYVCRAAQNVYKSSRRFRIQWWTDEKEKGTYVPDYYDHTDFQCVLTNLRMVKMDKSIYRLPNVERKRTMNILQRAINVEKGLSEIPDPRKVAGDGVDVSILGKVEEKELIKTYHVMHAKRDKVHN